MPTSTASTIARTTTPSGPIAATIGRIAFVENVAGRTSSGGLPGVSQSGKDLSDVLVVLELVLE
jgi:hypothetical protein